MFFFLKWPAGIAKASVMADDSHQPQLRAVKPSLGLCEVRATMAFALHVVSEGLAAIKKNSKKKSK